MPILTVRIDVDLDGDPLKHLGFPIHYRQSMAEFQSFNYQKSANPDDSTFVQLPIGHITTLSAFILRTLTRETGVRLQGGETGNQALRLPANGLIIVLGGAVAGAGLTANNDTNISSANAHIIGFGGGQ